MVLSIDEEEINQPLRNKFPEHRKIVLKNEVEEKIKKLVEKGIFE